jgi:hypothetical protein
MSKGQKRSNREQKKPKQEKPKTAIPVTVSPIVQGKLEAFGRNNKKR